MIQFVDSHKVDKKLTEIRQLLAGKAKTEGITALAMDAGEKLLGKVRTVEYGLKQVGLTPSAAW